MLNHHIEKVLQQQHKSLTFFISPFHMPVPSSVPHLPEFKSQYQKNDFITKAKGTIQYLRKLALRQGLLKLLTRDDV